MLKLLLFNADGIGRRRLLTFYFATLLFIVLSAFSNRASAGMEEVTVYANEAERQERQQFTVDGCEKKNYISRNHQSWCQDRGYEVSTPSITSATEVPSVMSMDAIQIDAPQFIPLNVEEEQTQTSVEGTKRVPVEATGSPSPAVSTNNPLGLPAYEGSACQRESQVADRCCGKPETCFGEPSVDESKDDGIGGQIVGLLSSTALSIPGSVSQMCGTMKTVGMTMTAVNGYLAAKCQDKVAKCNAACKPYAQQISKAYSETADLNERARINSIYSDYISAYDICASSSNASWKMAQQAVSNQLGAKFADMCKKQASTKETEEDTFATPNCNSPSSATTPICQSYCNRPGGRGDASCAGYWAAMGNGNNGLGNNRAETGKSNANPFDLGNDAEGDQEANFQDIEAKNKGATPNTAGGGVGLGGGGGGDFGGGGDGGGAGGGEGYNTKIDRGLNSGNGYSVSSMRTGGGGGFSGYGSGGAITDKSGGKTFNLKDFLPGGDKNKMRGLASALPDVAPVHADIFKQVSNRFYQICLRDGLYDCASLRKMKRTGN